MLDNNGKLDLGLIFSPSNVVFSIIFTIVKCCCGKVGITYFNISLGSSLIAEVTSLIVFLPLWAQTIVASSIAFVLINLASFIVGMIM